MSRMSAFVQWTDEVAVAAGFDLDDPATNEMLIERQDSLHSIYLSQDQDTAFARAMVELRGRE